MMRTHWIAAAVLPALLAGCQPGTQPPGTESDGTQAEEIR